MIEINKLLKKFDNKVALHYIDLKVKKGEIVTLIGKSGAGKTTLLHTIIGSLKPDEGEVIVNDFDISDFKNRDIQKLRQNTGIVFQDYKLHPRKTVFENVAFALEVQGYDKKYIDRKTIKALEATGINDMRNLYPRQISGGEKQRTSIARALIHGPELLIADEPTGNLDHQNTIEIVRLLQNIHANGTTVLVSTHDITVMKMLNKRVITLDQGKIIDDSTC
jgi:cell division transport system ATP-binding protein